MAETPDILGGIGSPSDSTTNSTKASQAADENLNRAKNALADALQRKIDNINRNNSQSGGQSGTEILSEIKTAKDDFRLLSTAVSAATVTFGTVNAILSQMQSSREGGSKDINQIRSGLGNALADLKYAPGKQREIMKRAETEGGFGPNITTEQAMSIYQTAAAAVPIGTHPTPEQQDQLDGIVSNVGRGVMSLQTGMSGARTPFIPGVMARLTNEKRSTIVGAARDATAFEVEQYQKNLANEAKNKSIGDSTRREGTDLRNMGRDDALGAAGWFFDNPIGRGLGREIERQLTEIKDDPWSLVRNPNNPIVRYLKGIHKNTGPEQPKTIGGQ